MSQDAQRQFERDKVCYEQNFEHARSLNEQMNQIPTLAMTLTGGLWFAAAVTEHMQVPVRFGLFLFAGLCNIGLALAILRVRDVFDTYLEKVREFNPGSFVHGRPAKPAARRLGAYSMVMVYAILMCSASVLSLVGAFAFYWPFATQRLPLGIVVTVGCLATFLSYLYGNWKRTLVVATVSLLGGVLAGYWVFFWR